MASFLNVVNSVRQEVTIENISDDIMYLSSIIEKLAAEGNMSMITINDCLCN